MHDEQAEQGNHCLCMDAAGDKGMQSENANVSA